MGDGGGRATHPRQTSALLSKELVTNASKHGFKGEIGGKIVVMLHPSGSSPDWRIEIRDSGVGALYYFGQLQKDFLGLQLVGDLASQFDGTLQIDTGSGSGFHVSVTFRTDSIKAAGREVCEALFDHVEPQTTQPCSSIGASDNFGNCVVMPT